MLRAVVARVLRIAYLCLPHPVYLLIRRCFHGYSGWKKLALVVKNWRQCWLAESFNSAGYVIGKKYVLSLAAGPERLIEVSFCNGLRLLSFPSSLGIVSMAQSYFEHFAVNIEFKVGDVAVDLGAHVGAVSLPLAFRGITVFAYEPHPENFRVLELNKRLNGLNTLHVFQAAVGDSIGRGAFKIGRTSTTGSMESAKFFMSAKHDKTLEVPTTTLASAFRENSITEAKLLKIDCEGSEYQILMANDAKDALRRCRLLVLEVHPVGSGYDKYQLHQYLSGLGFQIKVVDNPGNGCVDFYCTNNAMGGDKAL